MLLRHESQLGEHDFTENHLAGRQPVIVTGEIEKWPAASKWTWKYFARRFGDREVDVYDDWFVPTGAVRLGDFITHDITGLGADPARSYVRWFARHKPGDGPGGCGWADDVFHAIESDWRRPEFVPAAGYVVPFAPATGAGVDPVTDPFPYRALFFSAAGARTSMHMDPWLSSALLCQFIGVKRVSLYSPDQHDEIYDAVLAGTDRRELADRPATYTHLLKPGEILFIPDGWWHHVTTLTASLSLTWNFVPASAATRLLEYVRANPDDPELEAVSYLLHGTAPDVPAGDAIALVEKAIAAS